MPFITDTLRQVLAQNIIPNVIQNGKATMKLVEVLHFSHYRSSIFRFKFLSSQVLSSQMLILLKNTAL